MKISSEFELLSPISDGWFLGDLGKTCNEVCGLHSFACTEDNLHSHNSDVDSSDKVLNLVQSLGGSISNPPCLNDIYGSNGDVPNIGGDHQSCYYSDANRDLSTFDCSRAPDSNKQRLCYCHKQG